MKIALSGYYGFDNAGDEALLSAITSTIRSFQPDVDFVVFSGYPDKTARRHGLRAINRMNPWALARELKDSDLLISGGGSLFQDVTSARSLPYYISIVALAKMMGKPVIFYAQGVGPINRGLSKLLMRRIANKVELITLRDEDSEQLLKRIGVTRPPVIVTADPVFTLTIEPKTHHNMKERLHTYCPEERPVLGVSVRKWQHLKGYQEILAELLDIMSRDGYQVVFVPMEFPADIAEAEIIAGLMKERAAIIRDELDSGQHIALISQLDLMIGMRLHALIFAASQETLFMGISYDPKIDAFLNMFDLKTLSGEANAMKKQIDELLASPAKQEAILAKSRLLRSKAEETAHLALSLIKNKESRRGTD